MCSPRYKRLPCEAAVQLRAFTTGGTLQNSYGFPWARAIGCSLAAIALIAVLTVVGWKAGWWLQRAQTDEKVRVQRHNIGAQQAFQDAAERYVLDYEVLEGPGKANAERRACDQIGNLTDTFLTDELSEFREAHC